MARQGTNYGLNSDFIYNEFELDSSNAFNSFNSEYASTDWPFFILGKPLNNIAAIKVIEASIPFTYYTIPTPPAGYVLNPTTLLTGNSFHFSENTPATGTIYEVYIQPGNYDSSSYSLYTSWPVPANPPVSTSLAQQIAWALTNSSPGHFVYNVVYYAQAQKFIIYSNDVSGVDTFTLYFNYSATNGPAVNKLNYLFGFPVGSVGNAGNKSAIVGSINYLLNPLAVAGPSLVSKNAIQLSGPIYLYICSRTLGPLVKLYIPSNIAGMAADGPQIAKVPVNVNSGFTIDWQDPDPQKWFNMNNLTNLQQLDLFITLGGYSELTPLVLNGAAFSIKLGILQSEITQQANVGGGYQNSRVTTSVGPIT